jgi:hypothetical protein
LPYPGQNIGATDTMVRKTSENSPCIGRPFYVDFHVRKSSDKFMLPSHLKSISKCKNGLESMTLFESIFIFRKGPFKTVLLSSLIPAIWSSDIVDYSTLESQIEALDVVLTGRSGT